MRTTTGNLTLITAGILTLGSPLAGQSAFKLGPLDGYLMPEAEEISLARSAGPDNVREGATILVLDASGEYRTAVDGENDWTCFVGRAWTGPAPVVDGRRVLVERHVDPMSRGPQCFNAAATNTVLEWHRLTTRLLFQGHDTHQVEDRVQEALDRGDLGVPPVGAMSFMLSPRSHLNQVVGRWLPHYMFYTPYVTSGSYGDDGISGERPFVTDGGGVWAITTVVAPAWSDGTPVGGDGPLP